jgi:pimeloyl-ACP methyl ester carboxylesterase
MTKSLLLALITGCAAVALTAQTQQPVGQQQKTGKENMWKHEYAEINGLKLHYVAVGKGKTILFLHGFPEFWYEWRQQLVEFGKDHFAVAPDMRGYNLSAKPPKVEDYAVPLLVADVKAMLDKFSKGEKAVLVAHDWGGAVAWAFAIAHPEYLEKLVIINAPHPGVFARELRSNPAQQKASGYMLMFRGEQAESLLSANNYEALVNAVLKGTARPDVFSEEDQKAYIEAWSQPGALTGGLNYYRAARVGPPAPATEGESAKADPAPFVQAPSLTVKVPTLVIWGEKDTALLTGNLEGLDQFVPNLQIKRIPNGTHWVIHEEPELVNRYIREFISGKGK